MYAIKTISDFIKEMNDFKIEWKPLVYQNVKRDMYEISNYGHVRNINTGHMLSYQISEKGYLMVPLMTFSGRNSEKKVHRLVATHFVEGRTEAKCEVDHIDCNKLNCRADNLEWVTRLENMRRAYKNKLVPIKYCEEASNAKLTNDEVHEICKSLLKHRGICTLVHNEVKDHIDCTRAMIHRIKYKHSYRTISDLYFNKDEFPKFIKAQRLSKLT